ncbi:hypothetical protein C2R22_05695 [Salinigranum rubrum]|uniref:Uncharacterized protein n=1 Tax=Salinigranum rubrum TaxID=755307 RepID=A0A2I8VH05_9EURY|nr:hypothetical protein C2R22_05695 [Salinigranum rubrum]
MRIQKTEARERRWKHLRKATDRGHTSTALDEAANYYLRMRGNTGAYPAGLLSELITRAEDEGSLTAAEIVEILDCDELPLSYESKWSVG